MPKSPVLRKGQVLLLGLSVGIFIFFIIVATYFNYLVSDSSLASSEFENVERQTYLALSALTSDGYPVDWKPDSVRSLGLFKEGIVTEDRLGNLSMLPYNKSLRLMGISGDAYIAIEYPSGSFYYGPLGFSGDFSTVDADHLGQAEKLVLVEVGNKLERGKLIVYVWS